eukprot:gnl/TRDRNA2_/TRDRNA2_91503_c0_seq1.p1 gnl/TRDRNA2_/TRDRNA2_91503_c0~~gnl/TRDRNA2_/TRDRNA2_91503_c0_seq1.p1  ORF type:complete len:267 (+),score=25.46 gnl/TRDRNA2_/TRDRNA2_91503_c0_seq1:206-1006(+)
MSPWLVLAAFCIFFVMFAVVAPLYTVVSSLYDVMDKSDIVAAQRLRDERKDMFEAVVIKNGVEYTGDCSQMRGQHEACSAGAEVDVMCKDKLSQLAPVERTISTSRVFRHLSWSDGCTDSYVPWLLVTIQLAPGFSAHRCAFAFGTRANSVVDDRRSPYVSDPLPGPGDSTTVWTEHSRDRCVVGFADLSEFVSREISADWWALVRALAPAVWLSCLAIACCSLGGPVRIVKRLKERLIPSVPSDDAVAETSAVSPQTRDYEQVSG